MLKNKILNRESGIILYGLTPPKKDNSPEKISEIAETQLKRIEKLNIDGIVLYDIQPETDRTIVERPFPFTETLDPFEYSNSCFNSLKTEKIIYRCVGKYSEEQFKSYLQEAGSSAYTVFVGAASSNQKVSLSMRDAYRIRKEENPDILLGGVSIPERHIVKQDEHLRIIKKIESGCNYFITQCVYNVEASKNFLSDYYYYCIENSLEPVPIIFTITPCGSAKTLEFMKWLGINIPRWLENDLLHSENILEKSVEICKKIITELVEFSQEKSIPVGCNIESVSIRKAEIEAANQLVYDVKEIFQKSGV